MASGSRAFNFGTDDVLCSYDDSHDSLRSDPPSKEFQENNNRISRPLINIYSQDDNPHSSTDNFTSIVERCMKKYADTLMRSLDGISGRLAQLEMHCYKVERSVGELRADMIQGHSQTDLKFKSLEKHMQEVHRAVQIMRDKQELADTQKELAKLQMLQKESTEPARTPTPTPVHESTKQVDSPKQKQIPNNQLALVPVQQQDGSNNSNNNGQYVANHASGSYQALPVAPAGYQYVQSRPQLQEISPVQPQIVQQMSAKTAPFPQYQQQWAPQNSNPNPQQFTGQPNPNPQQFTSQPNPNPQQFTGQPNPNPQQFSAQPNPNPQQFAAQPNPNPNPQQFTGQPNPNPQQFAAQPNPNPQQFAAQPNPNPNPQQFTGQPNPNPNPQQFAAQPNPNPQQFTGQPNPNPNPQQFTGQSSQQTQLRPQMPVQGYSNPTYPPPSQPSNPIPETYSPNMSIPPSYSNPSQSPYINPRPQISKGGYSNAPPYPMQGNNYNTGSYSFPQNNMPRNSPYGEFIEKAVSMGYPRDQVVSVAMKMAETGQHMDLNALLDRLNGVY